MHIKTNGLVLRASEYRDSDTILTLLTDTEGKITARARGSLRKNSRVGAACQLLSWSEFTLFRSKERIYVENADVIDMFIELREDISKLSLGAYVAELLEAAGDSDFAGEELRLGLNTLYAAARMKKPLSMIKAVFELRLAACAGYEPAIESCEVCGRVPDDAYFNLSSGILHCGACRSEAGGGISLPLSHEALGAMRYIYGDDGKKLFSFAASEDTLKTLSELAQAYLLTQFERSFKTLDFFNSLQ